MHVRPVQLEDITWIPMLAEQAFKPWDVGYGATAERWMADPMVIGWVAEESHHGAGFILIGQMGIPHGVRELEILLIAVDEAYRRKGVGCTLLARLVREFRSDTRIRGVRLHVDADNQAACRLFELGGFAIDRESDGFFANGQLAIRMVLRRK